MRTSPLLFLACSLVLPTVATAQKMGHSNTHAPVIGQTLDMGGKAKIKLSYTAITWASGTWAAALQDPAKRGRMRERINAAADSDPLGSFAIDKPLRIGGKLVAAGKYKLAFKLNERFRWQVVLVSKKKNATRSITVRFGKAPQASKRLTLNLEAGDANFTARLEITFGDDVGALDIAAASAPVVKKFPGIANSMCPLMDEEIDPIITVDHDGKKIGLCCKDCIDDWKKLSSRERTAKVEKVLID